MANGPLGVGVIGLQPGRSWASSSHIPALQALGSEFRIVGVANTNPVSARKAADAFGIPVAFQSVEALVSDPRVDVVAVTVRVPFHKALVTAAIDAGKHVYCEWPLGNGLAEADALAGLAESRGVVAVAGMQATRHPAVRDFAARIADGYVGDVLSSSLITSGIWFGPTVDQPNAYTLDDANGATMLTIGVGHCLIAIESVLGPIAELSATLATRRPTAINEQTGETVERRSADQVLVSATLSSGAPLSLHYRGGPARGPGLSWEVNGTHGDLRLVGPGGHPQFVPLELYGGRGDDATMERLSLPAGVEADMAGLMAGNVRRVYEALARDVHDGTRLAPTFRDAVRIHRVIDAIQRSAVTGERVPCGY